MALDWADLGVALGLVLVIEGVLYALFPVRLQGLMRQVQAMAPSNLRIAGLAAAFAGLLVIWFIRG